MKITFVLYRQHIGRHFKRHWWIQSKIKPILTEAEEVLREKGIRVYEPDDILKEQTVPEKIEIIGVKPKPVKYDKTHPHWNDRICHTLKDENVLLEGLTQAKIITNTVEVKEGLPEKIDVNKSIKGVNSRVREIILSSHLFDAQQEKLPKIKDPLRPAWNFPRLYGITDVRKNTLMISKLLQLIEVLAEPDDVKTKAVFNDLYFSYPFERHNDLIQFELRGDTLITSFSPLSRIHDADTSSVALPNIDPIKETITLNKEHIYQIRNCYPIDLTIRKCHPHTLFVHYNTTEVKNIFEEEVTENQIQGRSLLKTFTVAASYARQLFGENIKELPKPVTLQCVHTDGRLFRFGVLQLNTLDLTNIVAIDLTIRKCHPHTLFVHYNTTEVKNIFEEEVTENQIQGRSLLKTFTVAASYARQLFGENIKELPKPVTLQCVHTDGRLFHFGVLQLNTLDLTNIVGTKNIWYQTERLPLFENCSYVMGKPVLEGYNSEIIKHLLAFYNNI